MWYINIEFNLYLNVGLVWIQCGMKRRLNSDMTDRLSLKISWSHTRYKWLQIEQRSHAVQLVSNSMVVDNGALLCMKNVTNWVQLEKMDNTPDKTHPIS